MEKIDRLYESICQSKVTHKIESLFRERYVPDLDDIQREEDRFLRGTSELSRLTDEYIVSSKISGVIDDMREQGEDLYEVLKVMWNAKKMDDDYWDKAADYATSKVGKRSSKNQCDYLKLAWEEYSRLTRKDNKWKKDGWKKKCKQEAVTNFIPNELEVAFKKVLLYNMRTTARLIYMLENLGRVAAKDAEWYSNLSVARVNGAINDAKKLDKTMSDFYERNLEYHKSFKNL